jgi:hypothetical protein
MQARTSETIRVASPVAFLVAFPVAFLVASCCFPCCCPCPSHFSRRFPSFECFFPCCFPSFQEQRGSCILVSIIALLALQSTPSGSAILIAFIATETGHDTRDHLVDHRRGPHQAAARARAREGASVLSARDPWAGPGRLGPAARLREAVSCQGLIGAALGKGVVCAWRICRA